MRVCDGAHVCVQVCMHACVCVSSYMSVGLRMCIRIILCGRRMYVHVRMRVCGAHVRTRVRREGARVRVWV